MIKDSKLVKSVKSNAPKKGWKIEWADGKFDNFFNEAWLPVLDEAQKTNRLVAIEKEKSPAGYWNIKTLRLVEAPVAEAPKAEVPDPPIVKEAVKMGARVVGDTSDARIRSMALAYSKDLVSAGKVELSDILKIANRFVDYILDIKRKEAEKTTE